MTAPDPPTTPDQLQPGQDRYVSPWPASEKWKILAWRSAWLLLGRPTPKPMKRWRARLLRLFGADIQGDPFIASSAVIRAPWRLALGHKACLGPHCEIYNLGHVTLGPRAVVAQHAYLCGGSHNFNHPDMPLTVADITLDADAFIGAKALILMNVTIGEHAIVGAGSVITKDVPPNTIWAGNPAKQLKTRDPR